MYKIACFLLFWLACSTSLSAQATMAQADEAFGLGNYDKALPTYAIQHKKTPQDPELNYKLGVCYFRSKDAQEQLKALPYLETATQKDEAKVPKRAFYFLGKVYHLHQKFDEAVQQFEKFKATNDTKDKFWADNQHSIEMANSAKNIIKAPLNVNVQNLGKPINTENTEYASVISADERILAYTSSQKNATSEVSEKIMLVKKKDYIWGTPEVIDFKLNKNVGTVAMSADGQKLWVYIGGNNNTGGIYSSMLQTNWTTPEKLNGDINSGYLETTASLSPDETTIYFASDRPGGLGGKDIYKAEKQADGSWGKAENLGANINTPYDEDAPFIHPDKKTLYFSSNGHNTIGGMDIFKATFDAGNWGKPANMGFPVNTVFNDGYFVLSADGKKGFFSSDRIGGLGKQDIYSVLLPDAKNGAALTMVKGKILAGTPPIPISAKIRVLDKETNEVLKYVYNPNPKTGDYLLIFPPGKNYDMIIMADGYLPYLVNINIPNQTYFYEMYQEIILQKKIENGKEVGQDISVKNDFDPENASPNNFQGRNLDLYDMMEDVIQAEDSVGLQYLLDVIYNNKAIDENEKDLVKDTPIKVTFYYNDNDGNLQKVKVGDETIGVIGKVDTDDYSINAGKITLNKSYTAFFESNSTILNERAKQEMKRFADYLKITPTVGVQILGYASSEGKATENQQLSDARAKAVYDYFVGVGIAKNRLVQKGMGANISQDSDAAKRKMRRTDLKIMDLKDLK